MTNKLRPRKDNCTVITVRGAGEKHNYKFLSNGKGSACAPTQQVDCILNGVRIPFEDSYEFALLAISRVGRYPSRFWQVVGSNGPSSRLLYV